MIGIYTQNKNTLSELLLILADLEVEAYRENGTYDLILWLSGEPAPSGQNILTPKELDLPLSAMAWRAFIQKQGQKAVTYQNSVFSFDSAKRCLIHLKTKKGILLTEKENDFLAFLASQPEHKAGKEAVLQAVWQYSPEAQTHTLESHFYALRQKLGESAEQFIQLKDGIFSLV